MKNETGFLGFARKLIASNKLCNYSVEYSEKAKKLEHNRKGLLSSKEHSKMSETDFAEHFSSVENLLKWYFSYLNNINKLEPVSVIGTEIRDSIAAMGEGRSVKSILSFGAGPSVLEFLLKRFFQEEVNIVVTDYDQFIMEQVSELFPELHAVKFDFYNDDPRELVEQYHVDTVIMFGSACSMDDATYKLFLKKLSKYGVKTVFTFEAAILPAWRYYFQPFIMIARLLCLYLFQHDEYEKRKKDFDSMVSFHAYKRTCINLKRIYKKSGWDYCQVNAGTWSYGFRLTSLKSK